MGATPHVYDQRSSDVGHHGFHAARMLIKAIEYEQRIKAEPYAEVRYRRFIEMYLTKACQAEAMWHSMGGRPHVLVKTDGTTKSI